MVQTFVKEGMERLWTFNVSISNSSTEKFNSKFTARIDFPIGNFMLPLLMLILEVKSLHTLFDKYLEHMLVNLNKIVWSKPYIILCFLTKMVNNF